jgi:hypothetical protein
MIEYVMLFGLGFLVASLAALLIFPLVHARATRLATRRLLAELPVSMREIQADRDLLRAEYAVSTRKLELAIERLKERMARQWVELGRKEDEINRLRIALGEYDPDYPRAFDEDAAVPSAHRDERSLGNRLADLAEFNPGLDESPLVPSSPPARTRPLHGEIDGYPEDRPRGVRRIDAA